MRAVAERLSKGEVVSVRVHGHSMTPRIHSGAKVTLDPRVPPSVGDAVLAKVHGRFYVHLVAAIGDRGYQITNIRGRVNGWTRQVFGVVTVVE